MEYLETRNENTQTVDRGYNRGENERQPFLIVARRAFLYTVATRPSPARLREKERRSSNYLLEC